VQIDIRQLQVSRENNALNHWRDCPGDVKYNYSSNAPASPLFIYQWNKFDSVRVSITVIRDCSIVI